jgi:molybdenum cofactor cytidylyltransferase
MDLFEAFDLKPGAVVAAVGAGGKTSLVYALGREAAERGLTAIVTSTTKFTRAHGDDGRRYIEAGDLQIGEVLKDALAPGHSVVAYAGPGSKGRLLGFEPDTIDAISRDGYGLISIEADGSAQRAFKAPAEHEPVIPASATDVIVCVGLGVLGKPFDEANVHRPEVVRELAGDATRAIVTPEMVVRVLLHERGGRKGVPPGARLHALLNAPTTAEHSRLGQHIASRLVYGGYDRAVLGTTYHRDPVEAVVT